MSAVLARVSSGAIPTLVCVPFSLGRWRQVDTQLTSKPRVCRRWMSGSAPTPSDVPALIEPRPRWFRASRNGFAATRNGESRSVGSLGYLPQPSGLYLFLALLRDESSAFRPHSTDSQLAPGNGTRFACGFASPVERTTLVACCTRSTARAARSQRQGREWKDATTGGGRWSSG